MTAQTSPSMVDGWGCRLQCVEHIYNTPPDYKNSRCPILTSYFHPTFRRGKELNLVHPSFQMHGGFQSIPTGCTLTDRKLNVLFIIYRRMVKTGVWHFPIQLFNSIAMRGMGMTSGVGETCNHLMLSPSNSMSRSFKSCSYDWWNDNEQANSIFSSLPVTSCWSNSFDERQSRRMVSAAVAVLRKSTTYCDNWENNSPSRLQVWPWSNILVCMQPDRRFA